MPHHPEGDAGKPELELNWRCVVVTLALGATAVQMGLGRHLYREASLAEHKSMVYWRTAEFHAIELATHMQISAGMGAGDSLTGPPSGRRVFFQTCGTCHTRDISQTAPALIEIYQLHKGHPENIVKWAKAPGRKRSQFEAMPSMAHLGDKALLAVANYMLEQGAPESERKAMEERNTRVKSAQDKAAGKPADVATDVLSKESAPSQR